MARDGLEKVERQCLWLFLQKSNAERNIWLMIINMKENWKCEMTDAGEISLRRTPARWKVLVHQPSSTSWRRRGEAAIVRTGHTRQVGGRSVWSVCTRWFFTSYFCGILGTVPSEHWGEESSLPLPGLGTPFTLPFRKPRARTGLTPRTV